MRQALWVLRGKIIAVPNTANMREAPSAKIIRALLDEGASLRLHDPKASTNVKAIVPEDRATVTYCEDPYRAAHHAHALLLLTEWPEYGELDLVQLRDRMDVPRGRG